MKFLGSCKITCAIEKQNLLIITVQNVVKVNELTLRDLIHRKIILTRPRFI